jgi:2-polyprenyl-6-methoxyphenol hydroxylase-like FAD-dependent oxidoreductase
MSRILVLGGGMIGLSAALMLTKDGHDVTLLERDSGPRPGSPEEAWQDWERRGVAQFRQPHFLQPGGRQVLDARLPEVTEALVRSQATAFDVLTIIPRSITDRAPREGDERFVTVTGRRPVMEHAVASVAEQCVDVRRGVEVAGLVTGTPAAKGIPHVTGVRLADGEQLVADLVIDAMGRRSTLPGWLAGIGARDPIEEAEDSGFTYYTRHFRSSSGTPPRFRAGLQTPYDCFSLVTLPADAATWSVTVFISSHDRALKGLRDPERWAAVVRACPLHAHLIDAEPVSGMVAMSGIADRWRRFVVDGTPVVTGMLSVGDSWSCTNPSLGRGISIGLMQAAGTTDVVRDHLGDPLALAAAHDQMTQARVTPWYRHTIAVDRQRMAEITACIEGRPAVPSADPAAVAFRLMRVAMMHDPEAFRAFNEIVGLLTLPDEVLARPGILDRMTEIARDHEAIAAPGPSRREVLTGLG